MGHRPLLVSEISQLRAQGCSAEDWARVRVRDPFLAERIRDVAFSGEVKLGTFGATVSLPGGVVEPCGVFRSRIHDCTVADQCRVANVGSLANYDIGPAVVLENIGSLKVTGETSFGNGTEIDVMNEAGGRTLMLCDQLSAQLAYFLVFYRHQPELVERLTDLVRAYANSRRAAVGVIGAGAWIVNTTAVTNVHVGPYTRIDGAGALEEGTIQSSEEAPVRVGTGVIARRFIILSGSTVDQAALLDRCLIGQSVKVGKQFSAENSVFFCNSELYHGEACSVFAGPYTVSHHRSTLLIAGYFSFYNAGSGTNQSNHMYKLGPAHQGILERGSKTGSFSYLLWPSRVGAFSNVIGKHYAHFDTADLPFSVINEHEGRSACIPAMNMFTVGTRRDSIKWPARDGRKDRVQLDQLHFAVWSPYVIGKALRGIAKLNELAGSAREGQEFLNFNGIAIQRLLIKNAVKHYELGIKVFVGGCLVQKLNTLQQSMSLEEVRAALAADVAAELYPWLDINGMLAPEPVVAELLGRVQSGEVADLAEFQRLCQQIHGDYDRQQWSWCAKLIETRTGQRLGSMPAAVLIALVEEWQAATLKANSTIIQDAQREFVADMRLSYGIDGDQAVRDADFAAVRGTHDTNSFVRSVREDSELTSHRAQQAIAFLAGLS